MNLDQLISVRKVQFSDWVDPFDVLSALPNYRTLTDNTLELLGSMRLVNDAFLRELAQRGILHHRGWLHDGRHITTAGILDYSFGNYAHDGRGRRLQVHAPQVCDDFLSKLIEVGGMWTAFCAVFVGSHHMAMSSWQLKTVGF